MVVKSKPVVIVIKSRYDRDRAKAEVEKITSDPVKVVVIKEHSDDRSTAQNSLYWAWLSDCQDTDINEYAGMLQNDWHERFKHDSLLNIFIADPDKEYAATMAALTNIRQHGMENEYQAMHKYMMSELSTTEASVKQFTQYLREIDHWCHWHGIKLRTDSEHYAKAMGK